MKRFEADAEFPHEGPEAERLKAFVKLMWERVVPRTGTCSSVQGELIRVVDRLTGEYYRNGFSNYYERGATPTTSRYGQWLLFVLDTLLKNAGEANSAAELEPLALARGWLAGDYARALRERELNAILDERDQTDAEVEELERLETHPEAIIWEPLLFRSERCAANWCVANPVLVDVQGKPVQEGGVSDVRHLLNPPPPPPKCPRCGGKGFVQKDERSFPERCACTL